MSSNAKLPAPTDGVLCANGGPMRCRVTCDKCREIESQRKKRREEIKDEAWNDLGNTLRDMANDEQI